MKDLTGLAIGPYQIIAEMGRGGMSTVYKAYQPSLDRYVAIKVLPQILAHDPDFAARFEREARVIAQLRHPNILPVYDFGRDMDLAYIVMMNAEAGTLKDRLGKPLDLKTVLEIITQVGGALDYAHRRGVVHRDVKPSNVLIDAEGRFFLSDFGLAKMAERDSQITASGVIAGTPTYMSPEQGQGRDADARSDIYSLGVMLYEMLTGLVPYRAETPMAILMQHIADPLPLPRLVNPQLPESVEWVILKALAKNPDDRFQTAGEMVQALQQALAGQEMPTVSSDTVVGLPFEPQRTARASRTMVAPPVAKRRRLPLTPLLVGAGLVIALVVGIGLSEAAGSPVLAGLWESAKSGVSSLVNTVLSYWLPLTLALVALLLWTQREAVASVARQGKAALDSLFGRPSVRDYPTPLPTIPRADVPPTLPTIPQAGVPPAEPVADYEVTLPSVALLVVKGEDVGTEILLETDEAVFGRVEQCDVTVKDEAASRQHAKLSREGDRFLLSDLGSSNGTFVNGRQISIPWELRDGDRIQIGQTVLEFRELIGPDELSWQGKPDRLTALQDNWQGALDSLHDDRAFQSHAAAIVDNMSDSLGFKMLSQGEKRRQLISFPLDAPTLRLKIPPAFPVIFLQREMVTPYDAEDLRDLIDDMGASNRFGLFITLKDPQETRSLVDETLRSMCDLIVLGKEDIARIVRIRDHRRALMESILNQVDLTVVSPFVTAGPVPENMFFGRENEIRTIVQTIQNNSMAIVGGRRIGKTSTLQKVEKLLSRSSNGYRILYMNCQDISNYEEFFRSINVDWQPAAPIDDFSPISFKEYIIRLKVGKEPVVVILDETDRILQYDVDNDEKLFKVFRGLSEEGHCQFLFSGERILSMQMRDSRSPLFNFCNILPLRYLAPKDAEQLITQPMALMNVELQRPSELIEQILNVSSCHPRMVQYICHQLIQRISQEGTRIVRLDELHEVTTSGTFYNVYIETIWAQARPLERLITLIMLQRQDQTEREMSASDKTAMIVEGLTSTEIRQELNNLGIKLKARQVNMAMDNLQLYAIVERKANRYRFIPQAFPRFLKEVKDIPETVELLVEQFEDEGIV